MSPTNAPCRTSAYRRSLGTAFVVAAIAALLVLMAPSTASAQDADDHAVEPEVPAETTTTTAPTVETETTPAPEAQDPDPSTASDAVEEGADGTSSDPTTSGADQDAAEDDAIEAPAGAAAPAVVVDPDAEPVDIAVTSSPEYWLADTGEQVRQTVRVTNPATSTGPATGVEVTSTVPDGLTLVSATVGFFTRPCTVTGRDITCSIASIAPGTYNIAVLTLAADHLGTHTSVATALATNPDPDPTNNTASTTIAADPVELTLTAAPEAVTAQPGQEVRQTLSVSNAPSIPIPATGVEIRSTVPDGLTLVSATVGFFTRPCTVTGRDVVCRIASIAPGAYNFAVLTFTTGPTPGIVTATATATSANPDPNTHDNTAATTFTVGPVDLALTSTPSTLDVGPGAEAKHTFSVSNPASSPLPATGVEIRSTVPDGLTLVSATVGFFARPCTVTGPDVTCSIASIAPGAYNVAVLTFSTGVAGTFDSVGSVTAINPDPNTSNNTATTVLTVRDTSPTTDLAMHVSTGPTDLEVGSTLTVPVSVSHLSGFVPTDAEVRFDVSSGLEIVQATVGWFARPCTVTGRTATCRLHTDPQYWIASLGVRATSEGSRSITASVSSPSVVDSNPADDTVTVPIGVTGPSSADVAISSTVGSTTAATGDQVRNTLSVTNLSGATATGVQVTATIPDGFTLVSATVGFLTRPCTVAGRVVTCSIGSIGAGAYNVAILTLTPDVEGTFALGGAVTTTSPDPHPSNDRASVDVTVVTSVT